MATHSKALNTNQEQEMGTQWSHQHSHRQWQHCNLNEEEGYLTTFSGNLIVQLIFKVTLKMSGGKEGVTNGGVTRAIWLEL